MPTSLEAARQRIAAAQASLRERNASLRPPPPEPTSCCGRGCNGCVWEGYYDALNFWLEDAAAALADTGRPCA